MADPVTSALVSDVVGRLTSEAIQEYGLLRNLKTDLSSLDNTFKQIQGVLYDAEMRKTNEKGVEEWLKTLKSASLEVENVLDEAKTKAMIQRMHGEMGRKYKVRTFFSTRYNPLMVKTRIAHKVKNIRKKLEDIDANKFKFNLTPTTTSKDDVGISGKISDRETISLVNLSKIYGRDEEKKMIVDKICNQEIGIRHDVDDVRVYAIWAMGGMGKTTLAQLVYNDETVKKHFDLKCWVYVSAVFDKRQIIKSICGQEDKKLDEMSLDALLRQLQSMLNKKKYFIIMDDVWLNHDSHEDMEKWEQLCTALSCGAKGSTVMVTTRKEDLAKRMAIPELQHNVAVLSEEESWSLFKMLAFSGRGEAENVSSELELIGKQIVKKCNGLPLAVKSLGSLMLTKKTVDQWRTVNENFKSKIQGDVLPALRLSYDDLPPYMKICFAYCCLFSKGEEMSKDSLIELWMANGFIPSEEGDASLYELGEEIFDCLVGRSFFQDVVEKGTQKGIGKCKGKGCKMHDLMHDLAEYVMRHDCAVIAPGKKSITPDEVLHLSLSCEHSEFSEQDLVKLRSVRSMLVSYNYSESNIRQIISNHVYLRVLYLNQIESSTLPESICKLIHLRYLKIEDSYIEALPDSIMYLQNLQVLIIGRLSGWFHELPKGLRYMRNLQCLDIGYSPYLQHMPVGIKELTKLRRLSQFVVGKDEGARIGELGNLNLLGWDLELWRLENVGGLRDAKSANLKDKTNLKSLTLWWSKDRSETFESEVLEGLEPNSGLQELTIRNYAGRVNSMSWMVKLVNLTSIQLREIHTCEQLPPLGKLRNLKRIELIGMQSLKCFHDDDYVTSRDGNILFPNLQKLTIEFCNSLVSLPSNFPKLQSLKILGCDKLGSLPHEIQSFKDLNQIAIHRCEILSRRYEVGKGKDWAKISHIHDRDIEPPLVLWRRE